MKKIILTPVIVLAAVLLSMAQNVGIGTSAPNSSAALEIKASTKGLLIPRTSTVSRTAIANPAKGLMVYDTTTSSFWFHNGGAWVQIGASGNGWSTTGNAGTNPAINFLGTIDAQSLVLKVNNTMAGYLGTSGNAFWGRGSGTGNTSGHSNIAIGYDALKINADRSNLVAIGDSALYNNGYGVSIAYQAGQNTAVGSKALYTNSTGYGNSAVGFNALVNNATGYNNTGIGLFSLSTNIDGNENVGIGAGALGGSETGNYNTAIGVASLGESNSGNSNTGIGHYALFQNTHGNSNVAVGESALYLNYDGSYLVAIGDSALYNNGHNASGPLEASMNTAVGSKALFASTTGYGNTASGYNSLYNNLSGSANAAHGSLALYLNESGQQNTANGYAALYSNIEGSYNAATGAGALNNNTTGSGNTADGAYALYLNQTGYSNVAVGSGALYSNTVRSNLVAIGDSALYHNGMGATYPTEGTVNTAVGSRALYYNTLGDANTANGYWTLYNNIDGEGNTATGHRALGNNTSGSSNTGNGIFALYANTTGFSNTALGFNADVSTGDLSYATAIGATAIANASHKVVIGDDEPGIVIGGYANWSNLSDGRFKENIKDNVPGLNFITRLRPVTYTINTKKLDEHIMQYMPDSTRSRRMQRHESYAKAVFKIQTGFVAQDVEKIVKELGYDFDGVNAPKNPTDNYSIAYSQFIMPLVKAVQEQQVIIEAQNKKNDTLQQQVNALMQEIQLIKEKLK